MLKLEPRNIHSVNCFLRGSKLSLTYLFCAKCTNELLSVTNQHMSWFSRKRVYFSFNLRRKESGIF